MAGPVVSSASFGVNFENAPTPGERANEPLPNVEVVGGGGADCEGGVGAPNIPVVPGPAFACASFGLPPRDIAPKDNS